jgi:hypothetical protein
MNIKDTRIKVENEVLGGMKIIKLYAWERPFMSKITATRDRELHALWKYQLLQVRDLLSPDFFLCEINLCTIPSPLFVLNFTLLFFPSVWSSPRHYFSLVFFFSYQVASRVLWSVVPTLVSISTFAVYTLMGNTLTAADAFTSLALFNLLRFPLAMLPSAIAQVF